VKFILCSETTQLFTSAEGTRVVGILTKTPRPSKGLVILVHGFLGDAQDHLLFVGAHYLAYADFDVLRLSFHSDKYVTLSDFTISEQSMLLHRIIRQFQESYNKVFLVAHSLGVFPALRAVEYAALAGIVLWDPSQHPSDMFSHTKITMASGVVSMGQFQVLLPSHYLDDAIRQPQLSNLLRSIRFPALIVGSRDSAKQWQNWRDLSNLCPNLEFTCFADCDHNFSTAGDIERLLVCTKKWLKSCLGE